MLFTEITPKTKVIISVTNGSDMQARFMSKIMRNAKEYLLAIPFRHKGLRVNFDGKNIKIHMELRDGEGNLWNFRNCRISPVKKDGLVYHKITCGMSKGIENRRGGRRFYLWENGVFRIDGIDNPLFTKIRDIGPIGFSFVVDLKKNLEIKEGMNVQGSIKNKDGDEMIIEGMIVRREVLDKYIIYGCKMDNPSSMVLNFIKYLEKKSVVVDAEL